MIQRQVMKDVLKPCLFSRGLPIGMAGPIFPLSTAHPVQVN